MAKKRANGEGNIRKRADGRWEGRYTAGYHPETGKRIIKNVLGKTQAECKAKLKKAIERMNEQLPNSEAKFGIHEATNRVMIKLVDKDTQEVIKEIPPEKTLDMLAKSMEIAGVLLDQKL